ncbi:MAG: hypothetical protein H6Q12_49 [Bacteroidetes bacterium]|nr:hypothetical protein [Bacteroidota bacterium]
MEQRPHVIIELSPLLQDFLYKEFECKEKGTISLNTRNEIGKYINSMITVSPTPPRIPCSNETITIILPIQEWNHFVLSGNFITIVSWKEQMIREYLDALYRLRIREFFNVGYEKGMNQDRLIKAFLELYGSKNNAANYDTIKKIDFRNRKKISKEIATAVQLSLNL